MREDARATEGRDAAQGSGSVLDDILAMILGRYPRVPGASDEEHFSWIREAHEDLKGLWREELGVLPKAEDAHARAVGGRRLGDHVGVACEALLLARLAFCRAPVRRKRDDTEFVQQPR